MKKNKKIIYSLITIVVITVVTVILLPEHKKIHHRGQIHNMLSQADIKPPEIDIPDLII